MLNALFRFCARSLLLLTWPILAQEVQCDLSLQEAKREIKVTGLNTVFRDGDHRIDLVMATFAEQAFEVTDYLCRDAPDVIFGEYTAWGWIVHIPSSAQASLIHVASSVGEFLDADRVGRYKLIGNTIVDYEQNDQTRMESSISFVMEHQRYFPRLKANGVAIGGPFWKQVNYRKEPIGFWRNGSRSGFVQPYDSTFNGRYVVCLEETKQIRLLLPTDQRDAENRCRVGFQTGPAYFEPNEDGVGRVGISGSSKLQARRNVLFALRERAKDSYFLWSGISEMSPFDLMVLLGEVAPKLGSGHVAWGVGLADGSLLAGPVVVRDGLTVSVAAARGPTGGILLFGWD